MRKIKSFDGAHINYSIKRLKSEQFLVFIHGAGGDLTAWNSEVNFFQDKGYSTLAIDLRGHGLSDRPSRLDDYHLDNFARDIKAVLDKEKVTDFVIIAHCFGGMVTMEFQKLYPNIAAKYILIDTTSKAPQRLKAVRLLGSPILPIFNFLLQTRFLDRTNFNHVDFDKFIGTGDLNVERIYSDISHTTFRSWLFTYQHIAQFDGREALKNINVPVLIIHGEDDKVFGIHKAVEINGLVDKSILDIIPQANHIIVINNSDILSEKIYNFLDKS